VLDGTPEARLARHNEYALRMQEQNPTLFAQHPFVPMPPQNPFYVPLPTAMPAQNQFAMPAQNQFMPPSSFPYGALPSIGGQKQPNVRRIISGAELERAVPAPEGDIAYVPTVDSKECKRLVKELETKRNRIFSAARILADRHALSIIKATQKRLLEQYWYEIAREKELLSYEPDWDYCDSLRWKSANADKSNKYNLDAPQQQKPVKATQKDQEMSDDEEFELRTSEPPAAMFSTSPMQFAEDKEVRKQFELFMAQRAAASKPMKGTGQKKKAARNRKLDADDEQWDE